MMNQIIYSFLILGGLFIVGCTSDSCADISCLNGGTCIDGTCDCPEGFSGSNCGIEDRCISQMIVCQNDGVCNEGVCECVKGYTGENCELIDPTEIQYLLDEGIFSPLKMAQSGVDLEDIYGKEYAGGLIFYIDVADRLPNAEGMVAAKEDQSSSAKAECRDDDNPSLNNAPYANSNPGVFSGAGSLGEGKSNTDLILDYCDPESDAAAALCRALGPEWFLPSMEELYLLDKNVPNTLNLFSTFDYYWSSSEHSDFAQWAMDPDNRFDQTGKSNNQNVRAVKEF